MGFFDDFLSNSFSKRSVYTEEEIEKAKKMSKKNGKSFMENLVALTGKTPETQGFDMETVLQEMREQSGMAEKDITGHPLDCGGRFPENSARWRIRAPKNNSTTR